MSIWGLSAERAGGEISFLYFLLVVSAVVGGKGVGGGDRSVRHY